jgi:hypothetical protein
VKWALAAALVLLAGCAKKEPEIAGVEGWNVKHTRLADATGRCIPEKLADGRDGSYCFGQQPFGIRGMAVDVDLYFGGTDPASTLVEIQMKVGGCNVENLDGWLRKNLGAPVESKGNRHAWKNAHLHALGYLPLADEPGRCLVRMIPLAEQARFDSYWSR